MRPLSRLRPALLLFASLLLLSEAQAAVVVNNGSIIYDPGSQTPRGRLTLVGPGFSMFGGTFSTLTWTGTTSGKAGDALSFNSVIGGLGAGAFSSATFDGVTRSDVGFSGSLKLEGPPVPIIPTDQTTTRTAPMVLSGTISVHPCKDAASCPPVFTTEVSGFARAAITVAAATDSAGVTTYTVTGGSFGFDLLIINQPDTYRAVALDSVTLTRDPFTVHTPHNFSPDGVRRVTLFVANVIALPQEMGAEARDSQGRLFALPIEHFGRVPGFEWLTQVTVKLPVELEGAGDVWVNVHNTQVRTENVFIRLSSTDSSP
jgi:hypothetical protein